MTSSFPREYDLLTPIHLCDRGTVHVTYLQAYTPFTKALKSSTPLANRPFLLMFQLGKTFISRQADLQGVFNLTALL